jgi:hypothetical protein
MPAEPMRPGRGAGLRLLRKAVEFERRTPKRMHLIQDRRFG